MSNVPPPAPSRDLRRRVRVETPENVVLDLEVAGLGSRALAALIDSLILTAWMVAVMFLSRLVGTMTGGGPWLGAATILILFGSAFGYFIVYEGFGRGQTPGKRLIGIRVVQATGHPLTPGAAVVRNLLRIADLFPPPSYLLGALFVAFHPQGKRLGDLVAGSIVVRDRPEEMGALEDVEPLLEDEGEPDAPEMSDQEFALLRQFQERLAGLDPDVRTRIAAQLARRLSDGTTLPPDDVVFLHTLYARELGRRRGRLATRGAARSRGAMAERFAARKGTRWEEFDALLARATRDGLDHLGANELLDFAARYREIAADLARARTYGATARVIGRLERSVGAGHNMLYRAERRGIRRAWAVMGQECPAAVIYAWRYVLVGFLLFAVPGAAGYAFIRERPELAGELLPDQLLQRADAGAQRVAQGEKYFEANPRARPFVATFIISNNVRVAFMCFAGGVFFGVGSLILLAYNGLAIGTISGHFANVGLLGYLLEFIVGHGVLELFAIWVAGAAGFLLGKSLVAPGQVTRSDALVVNGRIAVRMVGAATLLLLVAGVIEGFISAGEKDLLFRVAVSGASVLVLVAYLLNGARYLGDLKGRIQPSER
ncbi:MAG: hypothetical protein HKM89_04355 [Gemmatimonadales bacterium]|nr:hypothetical protein [Gemmatimonadales bacterium]